MASLDKQFGTSKGIKKQMNSELKQVNNAYDINGAQKYYDQLIQNQKNDAQKQIELQNQKTNLEIKELNQNKDWQKQDYLKEQKGAYADWQKQSNQFARDNIRLRNTGLSETGNIAMYTAYQNRVATARDTYNRAVVNYDLQIDKAKQQNSTNLAQIYSELNKSVLELGLQSFQYQQDMKQKRYEAGNSVRDRAYNRWADNRSYKESVRQFNKSFKGGSGGGSSRSYSYSSGGYSSGGSSSGLTNGGNINKPKNQVNKNTKLTTNRTPMGVSTKGMAVSNKIAKQIQSKGYITAGQFQKATKGLSKNDQQLLKRAMSEKKSKKK